MEDTLERQKIEKRTRAAVFVLMFSNFFRSLGMSIIEIGLPHFVISLAGTLTSYGIIIGVYSITQAILQWPMGTMGDKFGRKRMVLIGMFIYTFGTFLCYLAQDIIQLIIFRAIQGAGAYSSILQAMIGDHFRKDNKHGKGMSLFSVSMTCGYFGGIIIGGYISSFLGFRTIFLFSTGLGILSAILFITLVKEHNSPNNSKINSNNEKQEFKLFKKKDINILLKDKEFLAIVSLNSLRWFLFSGIYVLFIWQIQIYFGLSQIEAMYFIMILVLIYMIFILLGGYLADNYGVKKILIYTQILIISIGLMIFISTILIVFFIVGIFIGIGFALFQTSGYAILSKTIDDKYPELKGSAFGFNNAVGFFLGAIGPILICFLGEISDFLPYYLISIIISITLYITIKFIKVKNAPSTSMKTF